MTEEDPEFLIFLSLPPNYWDYRCVARFFLLQSDVNCKMVLDPFFRYFRKGLLGPGELQVCTALKASQGNKMGNDRDDPGSQGVSVFVS